MRDFQDYTRGGRRARRRWWLWSLPVVLAGLLAGFWAVALPDPQGAGGAEPRRVEVSPAGWIRGMLGDVGPSSEPLNVLVLSVDRRPSGSLERQVAGVRTDTIMLVRLVPKTGEVRLLSVPRDLLVEVEPGVEDRINAAYNYGGVEQSITAVEDYTGVPLDHYAVVDFEGFEAVVDAMGGVEVEVEDAFPEGWRMGEGVQTLDGRRALLFARYRGTACGDLDRIRRQQQLVAALRSKALRWNTVTKVPEIVGVANENVQTDVGLDQSVALAQLLVRRGPSARMTSDQLRGVPERLPNGDQVLLPDEEANERILGRFLGDGSAAVAEGARRDRTSGDGPPPGCG